MINSAIMSPMWAIFVVILALIPSLSASSHEPRALTENGPVLGSYQVSASGQQFKSFRGIPYAEPPVGNNRFKEPKRLEEKWIGEYNAQQFASQCLQVAHFVRTKLVDGNYRYEIIGDEDCLFVNVFTREDGPKNKDVVVVIHGGAFQFGSVDTHGPEYFIDRNDVVLVTFNYRLGVLGFLTTGDDVIPGNNGLKDQVALLQWVKRNIANFGGDPNKVTLTGLSAGGASVDYHYHSSLSKGLFQKGYSFSGSALSPWALVRNGVERTQKLAEYLGCPTTDTKTLAKCLRRRPARQIVAQVRNLFQWKYNPYTVFGPVVEVGSKRPFIDQHPRDLLKKGLSQDLPWIAGVTTEDGLYPAGDFVTDVNAMKELDENWEKLAPSFLFFDPKLTDSEIADAVKNVRKEYLGEKVISKDNMAGVIKIITDRLYAAGLVEVSSLRRQSYLYEYGFQTQESFSHLITESREPLGACHGDDFMFLINFSFSGQQETPADIIMAKKMRDIFFHFVKNGNVPEEYNWKTVAESNGYLRIDSPDKIFIVKDPNSIVNLEQFHNLYPKAASPRDEL